MPTLAEGLNQISFLRHEVAVLALFITGGCIVLLRDWRFSLLALLGQYVIVGIILSSLVLPEIALIKVLTGALICPMLYLAARQSGWDADRIPRISGLLSQAEFESQPPKDIFRLNTPFRVLATTLVFVLTIVFSQKYPIPAVPADVGLAVYWLILVGLLILVLTEEPLKGGIGLLTASTGFEIVYATFERSLAIVWLWAIINLLLALAISYLTVVRGINSLDGEL